MSKSNSKVSSPQATDGRVLRIGLVVGDRIVEERVLGARESLSIGTSERNTLVVASPGMPARFELFQFADGQYALNFTDEMTGRVSVPAGFGELAELRSSGHARDAGGYRQVRLDDRSKGRVTIAGTTLIFQFVDPPPAVVRPVLPSSILGGMGGNVDWNFAAFVSASFIFFFGFGLYLSQLDPVVEAGLNALPDDLAHLVYEEPPPPEVEQDTPQQTDTPSDQPAQDDRPTPRDSQSTASSDRSSSGDVANDSQAQASLADSVANQVMAQLLGANAGDAAQGVFQNVLQGGAVQGNLGDILQNATGSGVAGSGRPGAIREAAGGGGSGTGGNLGSLQGGTGPRASADTSGGPAQVEVRRGNVRASGSTEVGGTGTFDSSQVSSRLRSLQASINRCYEQQLATNPGLEGRVGVQFTITESGTVSGVEVDAPNAALGTCVSGVLGRMRFNPAPVGGSVRYSTAFVFSSSG